MNLRQNNTFDAQQLEIINNAVEMAEELVSNHYKMSASQWLHRRYDIKTLTDLKPDEVVDGPFAQIIRYEGHPEKRSLGSSSYDFFKICLQDHAVISVLKNSRDIELFPFILYIITHELIHIVRFTRFLQYFHATPDEKMTEEKRVHEKTHELLQTLKVPGLAPVLEYFDLWRIPYDGLATDPSEST